jgi:hypothetical protein
MEPFFRRVPGAPLLPVLGEVGIFGSAVTSAAATIGEHNPDRR